ncbi:hypothetical protein LOTGIDRAFT_162242 [Lottia gigantea]|uniref:C2H2-type domain-containing protein n=1 Tax=Lottia gigantea TaxID=225164 RepID=V4AH93_LOTGI|nr:hypothetical protein LOTGIDRAFT_162242 [Lottia gigantea]ESO92761.1 hypothetical protein LOTGIDRAFT_162242 [Lottia gigantea]
MAFEALGLPSLVEEKDGFIGNFSIDSRHAIDNATDYLKSEEQPIGCDVAMGALDLSDRQLNYDSDFGDVLGIPCLDSVISIESFDITKDAYLKAEPFESTDLFLENIEDLFHDKSIDIGDNSLMEVDFSLSAQDIRPINTMSQVSNCLKANSISDSRERLNQDDLSRRGSKFQDAVKEYQCHLCQRSYVAFQEFELHCQSHYENNNNTRSDRQKEKTCNIFEIFDEIKIGSERKQHSASKNLFLKHNNSQSVEYIENELSEDSNNISFKKQNNPSLEDNLLLEYRDNIYLENDQISEENNQSIQCNSQSPDNNSSSTGNNIPSPSSVIYHKANQTYCHSVVEENTSPIHINHKKTTAKIPVQYTNKRLKTTQHNDVNNVVQNCVVDIAVIVTTQRRDDNVDQIKQTKQRRDNVESPRSTTKETNVRGKKRYQSSHDNHITPKLSDIQIHFCQKCGKSYNRLDSLQTHLKDHDMRVQKAQHKHLKTFTNELSLNQHNAIHSVSKPYKCDVCCIFFSKKEKFRAALC